VGFVMGSGMDRRSFLKIAAVVTGAGAGWAAVGGSQDVEVSASGGKVRAGEAVTVDFEVANTGSEAVRGLGLVLGPPLEGWKRENIAAGGGQLLETGGADEPYFSGWEWDSIAAGDTVQASYQLQVPNNAEPGDYTVFGEVAGQDRGSALAGTCN
jgi:uncharacterized membrane protein